MLSMEHTEAVEESLAIAKIVLANPSNKCSLNAEEANQVAEFIETLYQRFTCKTDQSE